LKGDNSGLFKGIILEFTSRKKKRKKEFKLRHPFAQQILKLGTMNTSPKYKLFEMW
jgi:penicillin-binding protein-related factor A (putative recombinase)